MDEQDFFHRKNFPSADFYSATSIGNFRATVKANPVFLFSSIFLDIPIQGAFLSPPNRRMFLTTQLLWIFRFIT